MNAMVPGDACADDPGKDPVVNMSV
ncbi:hypothetical protein A2U01_0064232, partial [Trifolium medium]|nr:hypothetical protein [Trifolium medium]